MLIECCRHLIKRCPSPLTPHTVNYSACIWKWPRPPPPSSRPSCPLAFSLSLSHPLLMALAWLSPPLSHLVSRAPCAVGSGKKNSLPLQTKTPRARAPLLCFHPKTACPSPLVRSPVAAAGHGLRLLWWPPPPPLPLERSLLSLSLSLSPWRVGRRSLTCSSLPSRTLPPSHPRPALSLPSCSPVRSVGRSWHHSVLVGVGGRQDEGGNDRYENETVRSFWRESRA